MLQACADGELRPAERAIVDQHVAGCPDCSKELDAHRRVTAELFESLTDHRMKGSIRRRVLENLPEMERPEFDVADVNWRAKHPRNRWARLARLAPFAATAVVVILGVIIQWNWPEQPVMANRPVPAGFVLMTEGAVEAARAQDGPYSSVQRRQAFAGGDWLQLGPAAAGMFALEGGSYVKAASGTQFHILDARSAYVRQGKLWLDVGKSGRAFTVETPEGRITVPGTSFMVAVEGGTTTVVVGTGLVRVANRSGATWEVPAGYGLEFGASSGMSEPRRYDVDAVLAWAYAIGRETAVAAARSTVSWPKEGLEFDAEELFAVSPWPHSVSRIRVSWSEADPGRETYDIRIFTAEETLVRSRMTTGGFSAASGAGYRDFELPGEQIQDVFIKLTPVSEVTPDAVEFQVKGIE